MTTATTCDGRVRATMIAGVVSLCAFASLPLQASDPVLFAEAVERRVLDPIVADVPGAAAVVVLDGKVILERAWGVLEQGSPEPVATDSLFRVASVSKTFAAAAAAILVAEESDIEWHTPVQRKVPLRLRRDDYAERVTLKHLVSHSSGLMPHAYTNLIEDDMPYPRILERLHKVDFICEPGSCYGYQNVVFSLVGDVIQSVTHQAYTDYVAAKLFEPLAMDRASFGMASFTGDDNATRPHVWTGTEWRAIRVTPHYYRVPPAAGVNASIEDMRAWLLAQLGHAPDVLPVDLLDEMHRGHIRTTPRQAHYRRRKDLTNVAYGLGWRVFDYGEQTGYAHHGGYVRGMRSEMVFNRELGSGFVLLTNSEPHAMNSAVFDFVDLLSTWQKLDARVAVRSLPAEAASAAPAL